MGQDNVTAARVLLNLSKDKSSILNEKARGGNNVLMSALQKKTDECLTFIVDELAEDHERSIAAALQETRSNLSRESSYSSVRSRRGMSRDYRSDDDQAVPLFGDVMGAQSKIHPMYFMTNDQKQNIFHVLMQSPEGAQSQLAVLQEVLSKEEIQKMLSTPDNADKLPVRAIATTVDPEVLQWILDEQFEETLAKFKMIAARNKFGHSHWDTFGSSKSLQQFFGNKLIEYMVCILTFVDRQQFQKMCISNHCAQTELDFDEEDFIERTPLIDFITIKEIFRFTLKWRNPEIQKLILQKVDSAQHAELLSTENLNLKQSILVDLIDVDDLAMTEVVLSAVINEQLFLLCRGDDGRNSMLHAVANAKGYNIMQTMLDGMNIRMDDTE